MGANNNSESEESEDRLAQLERKFSSLKEECAEKFSAQEARIKQLEEKNHKLESCVETLVYKLSSRDPPVFRGDVLDYPPWREWHSHILPGNPDSLVIKGIAEKYLKCSDPLVAQKVRGMTTIKEVFTYLDSIFANRSLVSAKATGAFLELSHRDLKGSDHQKMLRLEVEVTNLLRRLECVGAEKQLTNSEMMVTHAMRLMPWEYLEQFYSEINDTNAVIGTPPFFKLFQDYLNRKSRIIRGMEAGTLLICK